MLVGEEEPIILQDSPGYSAIVDNVAPEIQSIKDLIENVNTTQRGALSDNDADAQTLSAVNNLRRYVASLNESEIARQLNYVVPQILHNTHSRLSRVFG